jgi:hypothetical protein
VLPPRFWWPDGRSIAFAVEGDLKKITLDGGLAQRICVLPHPRFQGGTWHENGTVVFSAGGRSRALLYTAPGGGEATPLTAHDAARGETAHTWPWLLVQYNAIAADPELTTLETEKSLNMDFLATYLVDPWTAVYVGYNNNQNSFRLVQNERTSELVPGHPLGPDSWQFFVKISYLLRF